MNILKNTFYKIIIISVLFVLAGVVVIANPVDISTEYKYSVSYYATIIGATTGVVIIALIVLLKIYKDNKKEISTEEKKEENK